MFGFVKIYVSGNLTLNQEGDQMWWSFEPDRSDDDDGCAPMKGPTAVAVSDEVPPSINHTPILFCIPYLPGTWCCPS